MNKKGYLAGGFPFFVALFFLFPFFAFVPTFSISPDPVVPVDGGTVVHVVVGGLSVPFEIGIFFSDSPEKIVCNPYT